MKTLVRMAEGKVCSYLKGTNTTYRVEATIIYSPTNDSRVAVAHGLDMEHQKGELFYYNFSTGFYETNKDDPDYFATLLIDD